MGACGCFQFGLLKKIGQDLVLQRVQAPFHACPGGTQKGKFEFFEFYFVCV